MARKGQVSIQDAIENNADFESYLVANLDKLICMEVYSDAFGYCLATGNAVRKGKLELGEDRICMARATADHIDVLSRFKGRSEPIFLFISKGKLTRAMFGANGLELLRIIEEELNYEKREMETGVERPKQEISEVLPEEAEKIEEDLKIENEVKEARERLRTLTLAARKKRVCERLSMYLSKLNFILFWPHCHQAHYDLYEKWDNLNLVVQAKETYQLTEEMAREALYMSDVDLNEACLHFLMNGECLVVLFKMFESDTRNFVKLMHQGIYEDIPVPKEDVPPEKQLPPIPAYERYAHISKTKREVRRERYEAKLERLRKEQEERERLAREQARLAREAEEERQRLEKQKQEEERMARLQAGLPADPEPEEIPEGEEVKGEEVEGEQTEVAETEATSEPQEAPEEEKVEEEEEFHSDVSVEDEDYIPPGGLFVPGLYTPANELAKSNGLRLFFPKVVANNIPIMESEFLPPHVLVMFNIDKRREVQEIVNQYRDEIIHMGIFVTGPEKTDEVLANVNDPFSLQHLAYTIHQYDKMDRMRKHKDRLALMVSRKRSLPLLQLAGCNPIYISSDVEAGERECLALFPVGYGDDYEEEVEEEVAEEETCENVPAPEATAQEKPSETEEVTVTEEQEEVEED